MKIRPITQYYWLQAPHDIRQQMVRLFDIKRSGTAVMMDSKQLADGHTDTDLKVLTAEKLQEFTGSKTEDLLDLFDEVIAKLEGQKHESVELHTQRMQEENLGRWIKIIKDIEYQAKHLGLDEKFREVLFSVYDKPAPKKKRNS